MGCCTCLICYFNLLVILLLSILIKIYIYHNHSYIGKPISKIIATKIDEAHKTINSSILNMEILNNEITILVVAEKEKDLKNYTLAYDSIACYSQIYGYKLIQIIMEKADEFKEKCPQNDFMFKRHCVTINVLRDNSQIKYLLFLDADMGVINPLHHIQNYTDPNYDLIFYNRVFNFEIVSGSYLTKNTPYAIKFLEEWSNYENKLPKSFHGTDNAAIHIFVNRFKPNEKKKDAKCRKIWESSKDWPGVWDYVGCARSILNGTLNFDRIKIIPKGSPMAWARDVWLVESKWAPRDFIFHGLKASTQNSIQWGAWVSPLSDNVDFNLLRCIYPDGLSNWQYKKEFKTNNQEVEEKIKTIANKIYKQYNEYIKTISK